MKTLGYGDYRILERLGAGEPIKHYPAIWTTVDEGLAEVIDGNVTITEAGKKYLKNRKCPEFPQAKRNKLSFDQERRISTMLGRLISPIEDEIYLIMGEDLDEAQRLQNPIEKTILDFLRDNIENIHEHPSEDQ